MNYKIEISQPATRDLIDIYEYISLTLQSPATAIRLIQRLHQQIDSLTVMPKRFHTFNDMLWDHEIVRKVCVKSYCIYYSVREQEHIVVILRVIYGSRNFPKTVE